MSISGYGRVVSIGEHRGSGISRHRESGEYQ